MKDTVSQTIPIEQWGRDHWSTFAYIETCIVTRNGEPRFPQMRCDPGVHLHYAHSGTGEAKYPTRLRDGSNLWGHDDWICLDDAVAAGLLMAVGTSTHPRYAFTDEGQKVAVALRAHRNRGRAVSTFTWPKTPEPETR